MRQDQGERPPQRRPPMDDRPAAAPAPGRRGRRSLPGPTNLLVLLSVGAYASSAAAFAPSAAAPPLQPRGTAAGPLASQRDRGQAPNEAGSGEGPLRQQQQKAATSGRKQQRPRQQQQQQQQKQQKRQQKQQPQRQQRRRSRTPDRTPAVPDPSASGDAPASTDLGDGEELPAQTLPGGPALIFAMARRMLVWDDENYRGQNDAYRGDNYAGNDVEQVGDGGLAVGGGDEPVDAGTATALLPPPGVLPRWHPHGGISDVNAQFRTRPPPMTASGYSASIRRNSRKRDAPSLWRHAVRTYDLMRKLEEEAREARLLSDPASPPPPPPVTRTTAHHEGAMVACAKLGLWREAFRIYDEVEGRVDDEALGDGDGLESSSSPPSSLTAPAPEVTDNMIFSLVKACIRGSKTPEARSSDLETRRAPLDRARGVLIGLEKAHGIPLDGLFVNPLAAAYQNLGLTNDATTLLQTCLSDRKTPIMDATERRDDGNGGSTAFNVNDVCSKDRESYGILVRAGLAEGNWETAVDALEQMTDAGMYPTSRQLTVWTETAESNDLRRGRKRQSWKKRRDKYWLEGLS